MVKAPILFPSKTLMLSHFSDLGIFSLSKLLVKDVIIRKTEDHWCNLTNSLTLSLTPSTLDGLELGKLEAEKRKEMELAEEAESRNGGGIIQTWLNRHHLLYSKATKHPFILSIRDGTIDISSFKRWLGQDYIFVREFIPFVASVLVKAWRESEDGLDIEVILGGMASLNDEISWFKKEGSKWDVLLYGISPQKANQDYCRFLERLMGSEVGYTVAITAFWAIEAVYQESFSLCLQNGTKAPVELMETCQRWGNNEFGQYCQSLQKIVGRRLEKASEDILRKAEEAFVCVLDHEVGFWDMSCGEL